MCVNEKSKSILPSPPTSLVEVGVVVVVVVDVVVVVASVVVDVVVVSASHLFSPLMQVSHVSSKVLQSLKK